MKCMFCVRPICCFLGLILLVLLTTGQATAQPTPTDPTVGGLAQGGLPGAFPTGVIAANMNAKPAPGSVLNGGGSNDLLVTFPASSPIRWSETRHNEGDISVVFGPSFPADSTSYPPNSHLEYKPLDGQPFANSVLSWRPTAKSGALLATVRHNGVNNGDTFGGTPVGTIHGVAYFNRSGSGYGFQTHDGVFRNGGEEATDVQMGIAGINGGAGEAGFNTAVSYFPYAQGWTGAWVNSSDQAEVFGPGTYSPNLDPIANPGVVAWNSNIATVTLPGVNSATDGMLFVSPTAGNNETRIAAGTPTAGGWKVAIREDLAILPGDLATGENEFQLLYVPYTAGNLIGGHINGTNASSIKSKGDNFFDVTRTADGTYALSVFDSDGVTKLNESDGMLILSAAGTTPSDPALPDDAFFSYQYDGGSGNFIIQSRDNSLAGVSENQFGDFLTLRDADFYFAWVDFDPAKVMTPAAPGDFDGDGDVDGGDLLDWQNSFGAANNGADADGDGDSDGSDFLVWQQNVGTGVPAAPVAGAVPEPSAALLMMFGAAALAAARKR
jgi:hypothetical protein